MLHHFYIFNKSQKFILYNYTIINPMFVNNWDHEGPEYVSESELESEVSSLSSSSKVSANNGHEHSKLSSGSCFFLFPANLFSELLCQWFSLLLFVLPGDPSTFRDHLWPCHRLGVFGWGRLQNCFSMKLI